MPIAAISVPISSVPASISCAPAKSTTTVATTPRNSIAGKKTDESFCAWTFGCAVRLVQRRRTRAWKARSRLNAWTTAMPATDSASCAVTAAMRVAHLGEGGVRAALEPARDDDRRAAGRRARRGRAASRAGRGRSIAASSVSEFDDERRQALVEHVRERVDVARQPRDDPARLLLARSSAARATVRWSKRSRRSSSTIRWPTPREPRARSSCRAPRRRR